MDLTEAGRAITNLMKDFGVLSGDEDMNPSSSDSEYDDVTLLKRLKGNILPKTLKKIHRCPHCTYYGSSIDRLYQHILNHKSIKQHILLRNEQVQNINRKSHIISIYRKRERRLAVDIVALVDMTEEYGGNKPITFEEYEKIYTPRYSRKNMIRCQNCRGVFTSYSQLQIHHFHCKNNKKKSK